MTKADVTPKGKKDFALYEKKKLLQRDLSNDFVPDGGNMTVLELVKRYVFPKRGIRRNTEANYKFVINIKFMTNFMTPDGKVILKYADFIPKKASFQNVKKPA